jgi:hypothetical protein
MSGAWYQDLLAQTGHRRFHPVVENIRPYGQNDPGMPFPAVVIEMQAVRRTTSRIIRQNCVRSAYEAD